MKDILVLLIAIQRTAKDVHYHAMGKDFWSDHLLADRIYDGLEDLMDEIQENYFLGQEQEAIPQKILYEEAAKEMYPYNEFSGMLKHLDNLIFNCIGKIQLMPTDELTAGDSDLLGRICSDLQKKHGFLIRRFK